MAVEVIDKIKIKNNPNNPMADANTVEVDATGFSGNLSATDTDVQTALGTLDTTAGGGNDPDHANQTASSLKWNNSAHSKGDTEKTILATGDTIAMWNGEDSESPVYGTITIGKPF